MSKKSTEFRKWLDAERGRGAEISAALNVTQGAVTQWAAGQVPAERIFKVSEITGLPLSALRPDLVSDAS